MKKNIIFDFEISNEIKSFLEIGSNKFWTNISKSEIKSKLLVFYKIAETHYLESHLLPKSSKINDTLLSKSSDVFYCTSESDVKKLTTRIKTSNMMVDFEKKLFNKSADEKKLLLKNKVESTLNKIVTNLKDIYKSYFFNLIYIDIMILLNKENIEKSNLKSLINENFELSKYYYACDIYSKSINLDSPQIKKWDDEKTFYFLNKNKSQKIIALLLLAIINDLFLNNDYEYIISEKYNKIIELVIHIEKNIYCNEFNIEDIISNLDLINEMNNLKLQCEEIIKLNLNNKFIEFDNFSIYIDINGVESNISQWFSNNEEIDFINSIEKEE